MDFKKKRCYDLRKVKTLIAEGKVLPPNLRVIQNASDVGISLEEAYQEIEKLEAKDYSHSMTEYHDHTVWLDVYNKNVGGQDLYIKFKLVQGKRFLLSSFKKDTGQGY